jgi:4-hydroxybenzoate polyprenyltransferase
MLLPVLLAHRLSWHTLLLTLLGVVLFGLCSSGVYVLNDLLDLHSDRRHPWKNARPFATGELSIASGIVTSFLLMGGALGLGTFLLNGAFAGALALYAVIATWYSLRLKKIAIFDVFVLSSFYTIRIWAGALITGTPLSQWFLGFSLFFFLSLAMAKRYSELMHAAELVNSGASGRSYRAGDRDLLMSIGMASCFSAIVILSLYVHSNEVMALYERPGLLLLLCPLILYWTCRIWLKAQRGELDEDPVTLAMRDPVSYGVAAVGAAIMLLSSIRLSL